MSLIDFPSLISNLIWIFALAWLLSVLSMARWQAHRRGRKLSAQLNRPAQQIQLNLGGLLFCTGMALVSEPAWQIVAWFILAAVFIVQIVLAARAGAIHRP